MAVRDIVKDGDPILRKVCRPIKVFDEKLGKLLDDMHETMRKADGVGLAGPQVGILRRIAVVEVGDFYVELINPEILEVGGEQIGVEGCLSVEGKNCYVARPNYVKVRYFDRYGVQKILECEELPARAVFHETDHLDGVLFYDKEYTGKINKRKLRQQN